MIVNHRLVKQKRTITDIELSYKLNIQTSIKNKTDDTIKAGKPTRVAKIRTDNA